MSNVRPTRHTVAIEGQPVTIQVYGEITDERLKQSLLRLIAKRRSGDQSDREVASQLARARSVQLRPGFGGYTWMWCVDHRVR